MHFIKNTLRRLQRRGIGAVVVVSCLPMVIYAQTPSATPHKPASANKPVCSAGAICFSGQVSAGEEFHKDLNDALAFDLQLEPDSRSYPVGEWTIAVSPRQPENDCTEFVSVVNGPFCAVVFAIGHEAEFARRCRDFVLCCVCVTRVDIQIIMVTVGFIHHGGEFRTIVLSLSWRYGNRPFTYWI